jgi:hypothetical protein
MPICETVPGWRRRQGPGVSTNARPNLASKAVKLTQTFFFPFSLRLAVDRPRYRAAASQERYRHRYRYCLHRWLACGRPGFFRISAPAIHSTGRGRLGCGCGVAQSNEKCETAATVDLDRFSGKQHVPRAVLHITAGF